MPNITLSIPHQLPRAEARQRLEQEITRLKQQYAGKFGSFDERWTGDTMHFTVGVLGTSMTGRLAVEDQAVRVEVDVPWPLAMLAGNVRQQIEQEGRKLLSRR